MQWAEYIVSPEDTLAGIALARDTSIREIKRVNKLWSDTLWPGQKLRVPRRADKERPGRAQSVPSVRTQGGGLKSSAPPLLVRLRDLFDQHDTMYARRVPVKPASFRPLSQSPGRLAPAPAARVEMDEKSQVITIVAVMLRLRPFLAVHGNMTLTSTRLMFLPDLQDPQVRKLGSTQLQVDVPTVNVRGVKRIKPDDLDMLIHEDVGLSLQQEQRFLQVLYKSDLNNIVAADLSSAGARRRRAQHAEECSLYFMLSPESLSLVRTKLVQGIQESGVAADELPELVGAPDNRIPSEADLLGLRPYIPLMFRSCPQWFLRFCTRSDGISMSTLMGRIYDVAPLLMFVRTRTGETFGVYFGDELRESREYYGSDRTFVFRLGNDFAVWTASEESRYFLLLNEQGISVGADTEGRVALFDNDALIQSDFKFEIASVEFYSFEPPESPNGTPRLSVLGN